MRFELTTPTLARLCSTPELRPHPIALCTIKTNLATYLFFPFTIIFWFSVHSIHPFRSIADGAGFNPQGRPEGRPLALVLICY